MREELRDAVWQLTESMLGDDPMHGLPHIKRVHSNFQLFCQDNPPISERMKDALEFSTIIHDIGRAISGPELHAVKSTMTLEALFPHVFSLVEDKEWILRAVNGHSIGLKDEIKDEGNIILALLCVFDHMDYLGAIGIHRLALYWCGWQPKRISWAPEGITSEEKQKLKSEIEYYFNCPWEVTREKITMKERSFLECLTYYYAATFHIILPAGELLGIGLRAEISDRLKLMKDYTSSLCQTLL